ncbi:MAG: 2-oxo acid dehydrogenase subunit E2 [Candidatus Methanofastidiosum sp.]|nr:2-oxo acid dehydrogenase subunit E2 [Methanofastidiosum sp.]
MVTEFKFPDVGEGIKEGTIKKWLVKEGDYVNEDQVLGNVETDKAIVEIPSPVAGKILKLVMPEGSKVNVGETMVVIGDEGEKIPTIEKKAQIKEKEVKETKKEELIQTINEKKIQAPPWIRKLASDRGVDLSLVAPTGPHGRITEQDVLNSVKSEPKIKVKLNYDFYGHIEHIPFGGVREVIANRLSESLYTAPHAVAIDEADVTELWNLRKSMNEKKQEDGIKLTFLPFIMKAVVHSLEKHPLINSELDLENKDIIVKKYYNLGVAVDTNDGLKVLVIKKCEDKNLLQIQKELVDLSEKARNGTIDLAELKGSTFSITNYGSIGGMYGMPIINPPEAAILGIGKIKELPRVIDNKIVPRRIMGLTVSFDHRVLDGAEVARFINTLTEFLENPWMIIID